MVSRKLRNRILSIILLFVLVPLVSANGLQILSPSGGNINMNKSSSENLPITLIIQNQEPLTMFNITFQQNNHIILPTIASLAPGANITVVANIFSNQDFLGDVRLRGFFQSTTGSGPSVNRDIFLTYNSGNFEYHLSECPTTITEQDTVTWHNNAGSTLQLFQAPSTPIPGGSIANGNTFTQAFSTAQAFQYYFSLSSFPVTPVCTITVLPDSGLVNDPNLDAIAHLNVNVLESPTTMNINVPQTTYSLLHNANQQGAIILNNVGGETAFGVSLSEPSGWFTFSPNNFNILSGQTTVVTYTIRPLISTTNQTNQTYNKQVSISGNFNTSIQNFSIFIPFATVFTQGGNFSNGQGIIEIILQYCANNPSATFCLTGGGNSTQFTDPEINVSLRNSQLVETFRSIVRFQEEFTTGNNYVKEQVAAQSVWINDTAARLASLESSFSLDQENREDSLNLIWTIVIIIICAIGILIAGWVIYKKRQQGAREGSIGWMNSQSSPKR